MPSSELAAQCNIEEVNVGQDEEATNAFILQEATVEVAKQSVGEGKDVSKLFRDSEDEAEIIVEPWVTLRTQAMVVKTSEFEPDERSRAQLSILGPRATPTKKRTRAQTSKASKSSKSSTAPQVEAGRKKQKSSSKLTSS